MATMTIVQQGLEYFTQTGVDGVDLLLKTYSAITDNGVDTVLADITESPNITPQTLSTANWTSSYSTPTQTWEYTGTKEVAYNNSSKEGWFITDQAGTTLLAYASGTATTDTGSGTFSLSSLTLTVANA